MQVIEVDSFVEGVEDGAEAVGAVFCEGGKGLLLLLVGQVDEVEEVAGA